jgi:hypothetical protein
VGGTSLCNMPKMYYGIIKKDVLDKVKSDTGYYFPGPSPDMANAFSVSFYTDNFVFFDAPLFIAGNSAKSAAGMGLAGKHIGDIKGHAQLPADCYLKWTKEIPEYWSGPTIWAESAIQAIKSSSNSYLTKYFNFPRLYASCLVHNPENKQKIEDAISIFNKSNSILSTSLKIKYEMILIWTLRFKFLFKNIFQKLKLSNIQIIDNLQNVEEACISLKSFETKIKPMLLK